MTDLFGDDTPLQTPRPKGKRQAEISYAQLVAIHGKTADRRCLECVHLRWKTGSGRWPKCMLSGCWNMGRTGDWNSRWEACGRFEGE